MKSFKLGILLLASTNSQIVGNVESEPIDFLDSGKDVPQSSDRMFKLNEDQMIIDKVDIDRGMEKAYQDSINGSIFNTQDAPIKEIKEEPKQQEDINYESFDLQGEDQKNEEVGVGRTTHRISRFK